MKYVANPVVVDAHVITAADSIADDGSMPLRLDNGDHVHADPGMISRYRPVVGDYWVIQDGGYTYVNPKDVFERKYSPLEES